MALIFAVILTACGVKGPPIPYVEAYPPPVEKAEPKVAPPK